jgi:hypothetical protein
VSTADDRSRPTRTSSPSASSIARRMGVAQLPRMGRVAPPVTIQGRALPRTERVLPRHSHEMDFPLAPVRDAGVGGDGVQAWAAFDI